MISASRFDVSLAPVPISGAARLLAALLLAAGLAGCQSSRDGSAFENAPPVVEVTMADYAFVAPDSIPSGWTTFRVNNEGNEHHNFHLHRLPLPDGRTVEDFRAAMVAPADSLMRLDYAGIIDSTEVMKAYGRIVPDWAKTVYQKRDKSGGMAFLAPERSARTTVKMEPGSYLMHCTLRTHDEQTHNILGMRHFLTVTEEQNGAQPPTADLTARISGKELLVDDTLSAGTHTFAFEVEEVATEMDSAYYAMVARLGPNISADSVVSWPYRNPAPTTFLGGFEYIDVRRTPYITVELSPGRYLWHWDYWGGRPPHRYKEFVVQ
jgi:hypothetical protein